MNRIPDRDEKRLIERAQDGDSEALDHLMRAYYPMIFRYCYHFWRDRVRAEDDAQEIVLRILKHLHRYQSEGSFKAWVFRIAFNHVRQRYRYEKLRRWLPLGRIREPENPASDPAYAMELNERFKWLAEGLAELNERERTAILLRALQGLSYQEIAQVMNCGLQQVKNYLFRGRKALQRRWRAKIEIRPAGEVKHEPSL